MGRKHRFYNMYKTTLLLKYFCFTVCQKKCVSETKHLSTHMMNYFPSLMCHIHEWLQCSCELIFLCLADCFHCLFTTNFLVDSHRINFNYISYLHYPVPIQTCGFYILIMRFQEAHWTLKQWCISILTYICVCIHIYLCMYVSYFPGCLIIYSHQIVGSLQCWHKWNTLMIYCFPKFLVYVNKCIKADSCFQLFTSSGCEMSASFDVILSKS